MPMPHIDIYTKKKRGSIQPLHGVNNGPVTYGSLVDVTDYYQETQIPLVRLHDPNWPHPREVDIHIVFPDFSKDPSDPASYNFHQTDEYLRTVAATGAKIVYRLGESIEHTEHKYFVHPPADYDKWAQICIGIIRHYNQGWANGFHYGIKYWEIWNEPDYSVRMWSGTHRQYYELYETAALAIKAFDPSLKVGGPAAAGPTRDFVPEFLEFCQTKQLPLDFFSWHTYTADPQIIAKHARHVKELLEQYGYPEAESHLNEWNYFVADFREIWKKGNEYMRADTFNRQKSEEGAAFAAQVLTLLQDLPVDQANYYDGQPTALFCGLFDYHGVPQKTYYAFKAFSELLASEARIYCEQSEELSQTTCLAAQQTDDSIVLLISHFSQQAQSLSIRLTDWEKEGTTAVKVYAVDGKHNLDLIRESTLDASELTLEAAPYSVLYVKVSRER